MTATTAPVDLSKHFTRGYPVHDWFLALEEGGGVKMKDGSSGKFLGWTEDHGQLRMRAELGYGRHKHLSVRNPDDVLVPKHIRQQPLEPVRRRW